MTDNDSNSTDMLAVALGDDLGGRVDAAVESHPELTKSRLAREGLRAVLPDYEHED